jgi:hypothetical protein
VTVVPEPVNAALGLFRRRSVSHLCIALVEVFEKFVERRSLIQRRLGQPIQRLHSLRQ